jgi:hypothetical protein
MRVSPKMEPQLARLVLSPGLRAEPLTGVSWVADACTAEVASQTSVELGDARFAMRAMHPRALAAEMNLRPRDADALGDALAKQVENDRISGNGEPRDAGPFQRRADGDPAAIEEATAPKIANVKTVGSEPLDR